MVYPDFLPYDPPLADLQKAALRSRSLKLREVLARRTTQGQHSFAELVLASTQGRPVVPADPDALTALARVVALQDLEPADRGRALALFGAVPATAVHGDGLATLARLLLAPGDHARLTDLVSSHAKELADDDTLQLSLADPVIGSPWAEAGRWQDLLVRVLSDRGLTATTAEHRPGTPAFTTVRAEGIASRSTGGPLVSVVMTTFRPGPSLLQSLRSITDQTWADLEILLVDDCSGPAHDDVLAEAVATDDRVRLLRLERNVGTYGARNAAIAAATGEFVTGQDDDDWAHPTRIQRQLEPLLADALLPATLSHAVWASDDLEIAPLGWPAVGKYAPSYLVRRELADRAGRYLPVRKAADTELMRRIEAMTGRETLLLPEALSLYRTRPGSLSRDDFAPGWDHPARVTFWQQAARVHDQIQAGELEAKAALTVIAVPTRFRSPPDVRPRYDVVLLADFRTPPGRGGESPLATEVEALAGEGLRVAILQLDDVRATGRRTGPVDPRLLDLVNAGTVGRVHLDDEVDARLLVVRSVGLMQYAPADTSSIRSERVALVATEQPRSTGVEGAYDLASCVHEARRLFGRDVVVMGFDEVLRQQARGASVDAAEPVTVLDEVYLGATIPVKPPARGDDDVPVLGALATWPDTIPRDSVILEQILPAHHPGGVRVRGRRRDLKDCSPAVEGWHVVGPEEVSVRDFLAGIDVLVHYPTGDPDPSLSQVFAAGCAVVTHPRFRARLGEAALYAWPSHAARTYAHLTQNPEALDMARTASVVRARTQLSADALVRRLTDADLLAAAAED